MRESRVIALAGVVQACALVREAAVGDDMDAAAMESSLASILRIDAESAAAVFGGIDGVRAGLQHVVAYLEGTARDPLLTQLVLAVFSLERRLARRPDVLAALRDGIEAIQRQIAVTGRQPAALPGRFASLYEETLSRIRPRIVVHGNPLQLNQPRCVERIRALLLAAVRAAVLWRQVGGGRLRLLLRRREYSMLARGLLAGSRIDRG
jgi:high frequency lysogenization protein